MTLAMCSPTIEEATLALSNKAFRVGRGGFREVARVPQSYWVYKRDLYNDYGNENGNVAEYRNYLHWKDKTLPHNIYLPEMHMLENNILAAQYISGYHPDVSCSTGFHNCIDESLCFWTFYGYTILDIIDDPHAYNVKVTDTGKIYIIDLGD